MFHSGKIGAVAILAGIVAVGGGAQAEPTEIVVRVLSRDAKFIGSSMGGAQVTLRDVKSGDVLAEGQTSGGTGDTGLLMKANQTRRAALSTPEAAKFTAMLDINEPRLVEVTAKGPMNNEDGANTVSATQWIIPGKHLNGGDGWVLEMPGFSLVAQTADDVTAPGSVEINADVKMMCGCPIEPGGMWNADGYEVAALVKKDGTVVAKVPLDYAGKTSQFAGVFHAESSGDYEAVVYAYDARTGNTGVDNIAFSVGGE